MKNGAFYTEDGMTELKSISWEGKTLLFHFW